MFQTLYLYKSCRTETQAMWEGSKEGNLVVFWQPYTDFSNETKTFAFDVERLQLTWTPSSASGLRVGGRRQVKPKPAGSEATVQRRPCFRKDITRPLRVSIPSTSLENTFPADPLQRSDPPGRTPTCPPRRPLRTRSCRPAPPLAAQIHLAFFLLS